VKSRQLYQLATSSLFRFDCPVRQMPSRREQRKAEREAIKRAPAHLDFKVISYAMNHLRRYVIRPESHALTSRHTFSSVGLALNVI